MMQHVGVGNGGVVPEAADDACALCREADGTVSLSCMMTPERLHEICRFYNLLQTAMAESTAPLPMLQRQVVVDMMGELIEHAKQTLTP
ncbi:hypothetical protein [Kocuria nitroreducens]|uniref:hypothetical protein n=1 Tax=Kocuria nitroreducens TaxID=3058914 RepID=UPI0036DBF362